MISNTIYDYLLVGAGLFNAVFAHEAVKNGKKCLVVEKRNHLGGNLYCKSIEGVNVHMHGPHIFHTNKPKVWEYVSGLTNFNHFVNSPLAKYKNKVYNLPFNMNTFSQLWNVTTPEEAMKKIEEQREDITKPRNLEEQALALCGKDIYRILIKGYTEKSVGKKCDTTPGLYH